MLDESVLNLQITILLFFGMLIFMRVCYRRKDLIIFIPTYILAPIGYLFIYLQIINNFYRLMGNAIFLLGNLTLLLAIFYDYYKEIHTDTNSDKRKIIFSLIPFLIIIIQVIFSLLLILAIYLIVKLNSIKKSTKNVSLIIFLSSALLTGIATILSYLDLPGMWEFSFVGMFIFSTCYFVFPILIYLEEKLVKVGIKLTESEERYKLISENATDLIAMLNNKYEYEYINEHAYMSILGYSKKDLIGKSSWNTVHPEDIKRITSSKAISTTGFNRLNGEDNEELRIRHKDGHYVWLDYTSKVFIDNQEAPKVIVIARDITERKKTEIKLHDSEEKFRKITEQSFIGVVIEQDLDIKYFNQQFLKIIGYDIDKFSDWTLMDLYEIVHPDDLSDFKEIIERRIREEIDKISNFQLRILNKHGEIIWVELFTRPIIYQDRDANLAFIMDITDKKQAEQLIIEENKRLLELEELRKDLITRVSHELRTPLTSLYGASQIILGSSKAEKIENIWPYIEINYRGALRLKGLVDNLLDTARLESKKFEIQKSNINLTLIIQECIYELKSQADSREIIIVSDIPSNFYFDLDGSRISQVILNILSNAIKNTPPKGKIFIKLIDTTDHIDIVFQDTGVGITKEESKLLFEKFGKIERYGMDLDVDIEGVGLGLYISKEIVELHSGQILFESEGRNKGCIFKIRLNKDGSYYGRKK
ncbi:MAG: PAS domain-containing sensor histidine kinase [Promethearchaeota archaeon]|nr:MAG: PAS domain-containing sensor histidine kinase [Candidatus Lokiarchaeota archaeon]